MYIENWFGIGFLVGSLALLLSFFQLRRFHALSSGRGAVLRLSSALRKAEKIRLKWQFLLSIVALALTACGVIWLIFRQQLDKIALPILLSSGLCVLLSATASEILSLLSSSRIICATNEGLGHGLTAAITSSSAAVFFSGGLSIIHLTGWFFLLRNLKGFDEAAIVHTLLLFGVGSGTVSLALRAGTMFSRSAVLAADTTEREMGLSTVELSNPVTLAHLSSYGTENANLTSCNYICQEVLLLVSLFLGFTAFSSESMSWHAMLLPLLITTVGILASAVGLLTVRTQERESRRSLSRKLHIALLVTAVLTAVITLPAIFLLLGNWSLYPSILIGLLAGPVLFLWGEFCASHSGRPAHILANTVGNGIPATLLNGINTGVCTSLISLTVAICSLLFSYFSAGGNSNPARGLYGVALSGISMFSISGITLTVSLCGSLEDCAAHMLSLSDRESSRHRLNTLAAIGSAAKNGMECLDILVSVFTFPALLFSLVQIAGEALTFSLSSLLGGLLGIVSIFLFLGLVFLTMGRSYGVILHQARRQFRTDDSLLDNAEVPDYFPCVKHGMLHTLPGCLLLILFPLLLAFSTEKLLGFSGLIGVLSTIAIFTLTISLLFTQIGGITSGARRRIGNTRHENSSSSAHQHFLTIERIFAIFHQGLVPTLISFAHLTIFLSVMLYLATSSL